MGQIIELISRLIEADSAYAVSGDVYFRVRTLDSDGELSRRDLDQMDQGEEAGSAALKEDPLDFALWKARKPDEDTAWPSPWGEGRPAPQGDSHEVSSPSFVAFQSAKSNGSSLSEAVPASSP
ncbi:MAG TPA: hypothetical protein VFS53_00435 [Gemmatimonadota bacterium]|nr:hypothetical protein [Gemmatimonadota bacterium]